MAFGGNIVASAKAVLEVDFGGYFRDLERADRRFHQTATRQETDLKRMSSSQLKAARLQREYNTSVQRFGSSSSQALRALERLRSAEESNARASGHSSLAFQREERSIARLGRGALAGSGLMRGLGRSVAYASSFFLGGFGLVYALEAGVKAAEREERAMASLRGTLAAQGISWRENRRQIDETLNAQVRLTAFTRGDLTESYGAFIRRTGDVTRAFKLNALAADIARGKNISLEASTTLLIRAMAGNARAATTLGLPISNLTKIKEDAAARGEKLTSEQLKEAAATDVLTRATVIYGGQAARYLQTAAGKQALLRAEFERSEAVIGHALLPTISRLAVQFANYLDKLNRTGRLQHDVNTIVHDGTEVVHGLFDAFRVLHAVLGPVVHLLGGTRRAAELLFEVFAVSKIVRFAQALTGAGGLAGSLTTVGAEAGIARGKVGGLRGALLGLPPQIIIPIIFTTTVVGPLSQKAARLLGLKPSSAKTGGDFSNQFGLPIGDGSVAEDVTRGRNPYPLGTEDYWKWRGLHGLSGPKGKQRTRFAIDSYNEGRALRRPDNRPGPLGPGQPGSGKSLPRKRPLVTQIPLGLQRDLARAETTPGQGDDLRALRQIDLVLRKALKDKRLSLAQQTSLYQDLGSVEDQIAAITQKHKDKKKRKKTLAFSVRNLLPKSLREQLARSELTVGEEDDLKALSAEDKLLRNVLKKKKLTLRQREQVAAEIASVDKKIRAIKKRMNKDETASKTSELMAALALRSGFFGEFASNTFNGPEGSRTFGSKPAGDKHVTINFPTRSDSGFQNLRAARYAAQHAL
jgi:hypothetical protein